MKKFLSWKLQTVFIFTGILIGLLVTTQFRNAIPVSSYPYDELQAQQALIKSYGDDQAVLKSKILTLRKQIETKQAQAGQALEKNNLDILEQLKQDIGLAQARGEGLEISLNDGIFVKRNNTDSLRESLVQAADLRDLTNLLFSTGSSAIAINDQRVIASTPITSVGNTILVNNFHLLPPFTIVAIGDADLMLQRLNDSKALPDLQKRVKAQRIQFSVLKKANLLTPIYNSDFRLKYLEELNPSNS